MATTFAYNSAFNVVAGLSTTIGGFLSSVLVARMLGLEGTGVVAFATWIVTMVVVVSDLGIPGALARYLPELRAQPDESAVRGLTRFLLRRYVAAILVVAVGFAAYAAVTFWLHPDRLMVTPQSYKDAWMFWTVVGLGCLTQGAASFTTGYLRGMESFGQLARLAMISAVIQVVTTVVGITFFGIVGAMAAAITGYLIPALVAFAVASHRGPLAPELERRVNRFAWESWGSYIVAAFAWSRMEIFFLERSWGSIAAGVFSVSLTLTNLAAQTPTLLTGALLPFLSRHAAGDVRKAHEGYAIGIRLMAFAVFPACIGMAAITPKLTPLLFGSDFADAVPSTMVLLAAAAFSATSSVAVTFLLAMERTRVVLVTGAIGAILSIIVGLTAVPLYGAMAAAIGRATIQLMTVAIVLIYIKRRLHCATPYRALALLMVCALISGAAAFLTVMIAPEPSSVPAAIAAGMIVYGFAVKIVRPLPATDFERLNQTVTILPAVLSRPAQAVLGWLGPKSRV